MAKSAPWGRKATPQVTKGIPRTTIPPMTGSYTNVSRIAPSTGIYGKRIAGTPDVRAVTARGKRVPKGRGPI